MPSSWKKNSVSQTGFRTPVVVNGSSVTLYTPCINCCVSLSLFILSHHVVSLIVRVESSSGQAGAPSQVPSSPGPPGTPTTSMPSSGVSNCVHILCPEYTFIYRENIVKCLADLMPLSSVYCVFKIVVLPCHLPFTLRHTYNFRSFLKQSSNCVCTNDMTGWLLQNPLYICLELSSHEWCSYFGQVHHCSYSSIHSRYN